MGPPELLESLEAFELTLEQHVRWILECAAAAPPGGGHAWDRVLGQYGSTPDSPLARVEAIASTGQTRGAIPAEVRRAAEAMALQATAELDRIAPRRALGSGPESVTDSLASRLRATLGHLPDDLSARHVAAVCPPRAAVAASVGSIFANAQSTAKLAPWFGMKVDPSRILVCNNCGAPQQVELDFTCRYCAEPMAGRGPGATGKP
jgi:hypothetical protein